MFCRVALHEQPPGSVSSDDARGFREWIKGLAGFVAGYHVQDSMTGRMLSITIWESEQSMEALREQTPESGPLGIRTDREELFDVVEKYYGATHRVYSPKCVEG
jgi:heme-degrading monooxygenase HmoA